MCFVCFGKNIQHLSEKMQVLGFLFPQVEQKHKLDEVEIKCILIACFLGKTCARNYRNRTMCVNIIASQRCMGRFLRHSVESNIVPLAITQPKF